MDWIRPLPKKMVFRWSLLTAGLIASFWAIVYLATGQVPAVTAVKINEAWILRFPLRMSRWWDVLIGPIWSTFGALAFTRWEVRENRWLGASLLFGLLFGLAAGLGFGVPFGLAAGFIVGLIFGLWPLANFGESLAINAGRGLILGGSLGVALVAGLAAGVGSGLFAPLAAIAVARLMTPLVGFLESRRYWRATVKWLFAD